MPTTKTIAIALNLTRAIFGWRQEMLAKLSDLTIRSTHRAEAERVNDFDTAGFGI